MGDQALNVKQMIGARIGEMRRKKGMTQEELSGKMGIGPKYLSSIERGKENPTLSTLINLADSLGVDLAEIFMFIEIEDVTKRKSLINKLLNEADGEQLKLAVKVLSAIMH
ncbi:MAG: helix-turn-helix transcriptional regulator [Deltaproteobacteria bacterium]|nr:helix-turn-helix transcriptional regulator [Deltaproteobacteria bacterium]